LQQSIWVTHVFTVGVSKFFSTEFI